MSSDECKSVLPSRGLGRNSSLHDECDSNMISVGRNRSVTSSADSDSCYVKPTIRHIKPNNFPLLLSPVKSDGSADTSFEQVPTSEAFNVSDCQLSNTTSPKKPDDVHLSLTPVKSHGSANSSFEQALPSDVIYSSEIKDVIMALRDKHFNIKENVDDLVEGKCKFYFNKDYYCEVVELNGLCEDYPSALIVPVAVKENGVLKEGSTMNFESETYTARVDKMTHARIGDRFPAPVILFDNKYICRAGTLTCINDVPYNQAIRLQTPDIQSMSSAFWRSLEAGIIALGFFRIILTSDYMKKLFRNDILVLQYLKVKNVIDLMVECRKCFRNLISVSSCELMEMDMYRSMRIQDLPYPGFKLFKQYNAANRNPEGLKFNWSAANVKRELQLIEGLEKRFPDIDQKKMKEWDLVEITKNYLKILLSMLVRDSDGILIHCISGCYRTPLFISLLRLSLWADGVIHPSLKHEEMAYLTVAYDWYLFGRAFPDRWEIEWIMHFCFNFLPYIATDEFSVTKMFERLPADERKSRQFPNYKPGREEALIKLSQHVLDIYEHIMEHSENVSD